MSFQRFEIPYTHWVNEAFISSELVREINRTWPAEHEADWYIERAGYAKKSALMFPSRLPEAAQLLAESYYTEDVCKHLSSMIGFRLLPDPWFKEGPKVPKLGGGLHEIGPGGLLKIHVDFDIHPTGLQRAANLLIYLNEDWQDHWGGALELHSVSETKKIYPRAGTAVFFETNGDSWHGHPHPLQTPEGRARRSLALYYYRESSKGERPTTVYRR